MARPVFRRSLALAVAALVLAWPVGEAAAKAGKGFGMGSRGSQTFSAPPATNTAPRPGAPIERSMTQPGQTNPGVNQARPGQPAAQPGGSFGRGLLGGIAGGLLGAGLFGLLMGSGFGGMAGVLGLLVQVALIGGLVWLALRLFRRRQQPAYAGMPGPAPSERPSPLNRAGFDSGLNGGPGGLNAGRSPLFGGGSAPSPRKAGFDGVGLAAADFDTFEKLLGDVETAYGRGDLATLRQAATPEMAGYLADDLAADAEAGRVNRIDDVKLLQGDLAEAWREGTTDYATVAMRFSMVDRTLDKATGRLLDGSEEPAETTELWTFRRDVGGTWKLSAIQPA
ncbi:TIM44-like domain-containing protein [Blastochloris sulfoviridis]|nr:TIM44-like domain-containing protein [Blastochloris sulfoviridis]